LVFIFEKKDFRSNKKVFIFEKRTLEGENWSLILKKGLRKQFKGLYFQTKTFKLGKKVFIFDKKSTKWRF